MVDMRAMEQMVMSCTVEVVKSGRIHSTKVESTTYRRVGQVL